MLDLASWSVWSCMCWKGNKSSQSLCLHRCPAECLLVDRWKQMWNNEWEQTRWSPVAFPPILLPSAGRAPRGCVCRHLAAEPVAVEVGWGMVGPQSFAVALADFGQDVDPVAGLHTVVGLDVERPLRLNDLEHLEEGEKNRCEWSSLGSHWCKCKPKANYEESWTWVGSHSSSWKTLPPASQQPECFLWECCTERPLLEVKKHKGERFFKHRILLHSCLNLMNGWKRCDVSCKGLKGGFPHLWFCGR